jgi:hypothetical protein
VEKAFQMIRRLSERLRERFRLHDRDTVGSAQNGSR